jgi:Zn-dependent protease/predicted transcriptional regulator
MKASFRLGRIAGIEVGVHWTVAFIVAIVAWSLSGTVLPETAPGYSTWAYWLAGIVAGICFGLAILAHELAHALVAERDGVAVESIVLWLFGGLAQLRTKTRTAQSELRIALAGPLTSVAIGITTLILAFAVSAVGDVDLVFDTLVWFGASNILIAAFNLLPGVPLDGGRVLTAILWRRSGDEHRARARASAAGRVLGAVVIGLGLLETAYVGLSGVWLVLIGWLILSMAQAESIQNEMGDLLEGVKVEDVMTSAVVSVPSDLTVAEFVNGAWMRAHVSTFPLVDSAGRPTGIVTTRAVIGTDRTKWASTELASLATPVSELALAHPGDLLVDVLSDKADTRTRVLVVHDDRLVGIVSPTDVAWALERRSLQRPPSTVASTRG